MNEIGPIVLAGYLFMVGVVYGFMREDGERAPESLFSAMLWPMLLVGSTALWAGRMIIQTPINVGAFLRRKTYR